MGLLNLHIAKVTPIVPFSNVGVIINGSGCCIILMVSSLLESEKSLQHIVISISKPCVSFGFVRNKE